MRFIFQILFILLAGLILELFLPWWSIALAGFAGGFLLRSKFNFIAGFLGIALLWLAKITIIEFGSVMPLAEKVAHIFMLSGRISIIVLTCTIGGIVGGMSTLTGALLKLKS